MGIHRWNVDEFKYSNLHIEIYSLTYIHSQGTHRSRFLAIGLEDSTVRILSLEPNSCLELKSTQALPTRAESLNILEVCLCVCMYVACLTLSTDGRQ